MSQKIQTVFFLCFLLSFTLGKNLNKKTRTTADHNEDCHLFNWCMDDLRCYDYRCLTKREISTTPKLPYAPEGIVCDWFHHCADGYKCEKHRCVKE